MKITSISTKLLLTAAVVALVCFGATALVISSSISGLLEQQGRESLQVRALQEAEKLAASLNRSMEATRIQALALEGMIEAGQPSREAANAMLARGLASHPEWITNWVMFEPDGFDARDAEYVDTPNHDASGIYFPTWVRGDDGGVAAEIAMSYEESVGEDYYALPKELQRQVVLEPYVYPIGGVDVLMTSLITPVMIDGQFRGATGVDIGLDEIKNTVLAIRPFEGSQGRLLSAQGNLLADSDPAQLGKPLARDNLQEILAAVGAGKNFLHSLSLHDQTQIEIFVPISVGAAEERMALALSVPESVLTAAAREQARNIVLIGLLAAAILCLALYFGLRIVVTRPLGRAMAVANGIAQGRLDQRIDNDSEDEAGRLLESMRQMQSQLKAVLDGQMAMAREHDAGNISYRVDSSAFPGDFGRMVEGTNQLVGDHIAVNLRVIEILSHYADGDLTLDMEALPGEKARITETVARAKANLQRINQQIQHLVDAAAAGDYSARGEADSFHHDFRRMVEGLNSVMATGDASLAEVSRVLNALADGDLTQQMQGDARGVFARIRDDVERTNQRLSEIVGGIKHAADAINTAAREIASGNQDLSSRTEEQAASLEETASSMEELTSTVKQNAENARQANQLAVGASEVAVKGGEVVSQVVTTMDDINASSSKIVDIITVIDGIAFQTNILALNAAVEAARAGEQGRGFAVVASEVRALAQRSASAAKEIKALIDDSVGRISEGSQLVDQAGQTMGEIVTSVKRVTDIMAEITAASMEQSSGIEQVNQTVTQMDEVTQQNAALVEEATAAARSMEEQAEQLAEAVAAFRLRQDAEAVAVASGAAPKPRAAAESAAAGVRSAPKPMPSRPAAKASVKAPAIADAAAVGNDQHWQEF
ncbi:MAG TPA: methyl-accepting chemotaxis protein [Arenimonas sp.]|nr:methyl-accepting chemotaxis protein [Arenimonas sp.]